MRPENYDAIGFAIVLLLFVLRDTCCLAGVSGGIPATRRFVVSGQRSGRCPDPSSSLGRKGDIRARSNLDCARRCASSNDCLHYAFRKNAGLCTLYTTTPIRTSYDKDCILMLDPLIFDGCFSLASQLTDPDGCSLPFQYANHEFYGCMGRTSIPQCVAPSGQLIDCIAPLGFTVHQDVVNLTVDQSQVPLPCIGNWIILMQRLNGSVDFFRNWTDYKDGFGDFGGGEFWIGNEYIHRLTNKSGTTYRLRVEVQTYFTKKWYYAEYASFSLDPEINWYALHVSGYSGNAGDSLSNTTFPGQWNHNGMNFTTPDADNDKKPDGNCAWQFRGVWWFNNCWWSCLTCPFGTKDFSWFTLHSYGLAYNGRLLAARMMIRSN